MIYVVHVSHLSHVIYPSLTQETLKILSLVATKVRFNACCFFAKESDFTLGGAPALHICMLKGIVSVSEYRPLSSLTRAF